MNYIKKLQYLNIQIKLLMKMNKQCLFLNQKSLKLKKLNYLIKDKNTKDI